ncbi:RHS repeat-associated core domain-containing protein [Flavobacterium sp.]|uniref:RHS repeat-associated core domain-containing protein n=1 Tax=Flavobacterium sp. TaxID=239 RepID=UPI0037517E48
MRKIILLSGLILNIVCFAQSSNKTITNGGDSTGGVPTTATGSSSEVGVTDGNLSVSLTGSAIYNIPISVPPGINGVVPQISLNYNSQTGVGLAGYGWNISGLSSITRIPSTKYHDGPNLNIFTSTYDRFAFDGQRLMLKSGTYGLAGSTYQTENYSNLKISLLANGLSDYFKVEYPDGSLAYYGFSTDSKVGIITYSLTYWENSQSVRITYNYTQSNNVNYITSIQYGTVSSVTPINTINFTYKPRNTSEQSYFANVKINDDKIVSSINIIANGIAFRNYLLTHDIAVGYERLKSVTEKSGNNAQSYNPTIFNYVDDISNPSVTNFIKNNLTEPNAWQSFQSLSTINGDFDGDGDTDFINNKYLYTKVYDDNSVAVIDLLPTFPNYNKITTIKSLDINNKIMNRDAFCVESFTTTQSPSYTTQFTFNIFSKNLNNNTITNEYSKQIIIETTDWKLKSYEGDFNGDGLTDKIVLRPGFPSAGYDNAKVYFVNLDRRITSNYVTDCGIIPSIGNKPEINTGKLVYIADVNGDGKSDIIVVNYEFNKIVVYSLDNNNNLVQLWETVINIHLKETTVAAGNCHYYDKPIYVFGSDPPSYINQQQLYCDTPGRTFEYPICIGDYNGDGKSDIMLPGMDRKLLMSTGFAFVIETFPSNFPSAQDLSGLTNVDFNNDGKTDVLFITPGENTSFSINTFIRKSAGVWTNSSFVNGYNNPNDPTATAIVVPFMLKRSKTYNGKSQLVCFERSFSLTSNNNIVKIGFLTNLNSLSFPAKAIKEIIIGNGVKETITYSNLIDNNGSYNAALPSEIYPNIDLINMPNINVVTQIEKQTKVISKKQLFKYYGATSNIEGQGFLGFRSMLKTNWFYDVSKIISNVTNYNISKVDDLHNFTFKGAPSESYSVLGLSTLGAPFQPTNPYINWTRYTYNYDLFGDIIYTPFLSNKVFKLQNTNTQIYDGLNGNVVNIETKYDAYNNPLRITTLKSNSNLTDTKSTIENFGYDNLPTVTPYFIGRPKSKIVSTSIQPSNDVSIDEQLYIYDTNLLKEIKKRTTNSSLTTDYITENNNYDLFGNIITKTISTPNEVNRVSSFQYDSSKRFILKKIDLQSLATDYTYNLSNGLLLTETLPSNAGSPLITTHSYDAWGKKTWTRNYLNKVETYGYANTSDGIVITTTGPVGEDYGSKIILDDLGRKNHEGIKTIDGNWSYTSTYYDIQDNPVLVTQPYIAGIDGVGTFDSWNEMQYDIYNRIIQSNTLISDSFSGKQTTYSYSGLSITENDGQKNKVTTKNPFDNIISVVETPIGISPTTINFTYFANGNLKTTSTSGVNTIIEQDGWGRKITLDDPSAGVFKYTYNNFGEVKTEEVVNKGKTTYTIDNFGKVISKTVIGTGGDSTNSTTNYNFDGISKLLTGLLFTDVTNNFTINYTYGYDNYRRLNNTTETRTSNFLFQKDYTFDAYGRPEKEHFYAKDLTTNKESDKWIKTIYKNGFDYQLFDMTSSTVVSSTKLFQINTVNQQGNIKTAIMGNGVTIANTYDIYGFPTQIKQDKSTTNILTLNTVFDTEFGNLTNRISNLFGTGSTLWNENLIYDKFDRLTSYQDSNDLQTQSYNSNGTISANNIGNYAYNLTNGSLPKPYTVSTVTPPTAPLDVYNYYNNRKQNVTYNLFNCPIAITEQGKENIDFEYNDQNNRSVMYYGDLTTTKSARIMKKYYSSDGSMEIKRRTVNGISINDFVTYIGGDGYTAPVVYKSDGITKNYFYLHRDYQGSILAITNSTGIIIEKRFFDVWGSLIKYAGSNGVSVLPTTTANSLFLDRGYTGHEHLLGVGLINMNARLYDNKLHRFLQPDNNLQDASNSQNYNRYSYCLNNPTKYFDPSGNDGEESNGGGIFQAAAYVLSFFTNSYTNNFYIPPYSTEIVKNESHPQPVLPSWITYESASMYINTSFGSVSLGFASGESMGFNYFNNKFSSSSPVESHSYVADGGGNLIQSQWKNFSKIASDSSIRLEYYFDKNKYIFNNATNQAEYAMSRYHIQQSTRSQLSDLGRAFSAISKSSQSQLETAKLYASRMWTSSGELRGGKFSAQLFKYGGKTLVVTGVAMSAYKVYNSNNRSLALTKEIGGWAGAYEGAVIGAAYGSLIGPWGTVIGGFVGGAVGYWAGSTSGEILYNTINP